MMTFLEFVKRAGIEMTLDYQGVHADHQTTHKPARERTERDAWPHFLWGVTLTLLDEAGNHRYPYHAHSFTTTYRLGLAHCTRVRPVGPKKPVIQTVTPEIAKALAPYGKRVTVADMEGVVYPTPPTLAGVLQSLQSDAQSGEFLLFEDFADEFGFDPDSRSAEATWRQCQDVRGRLEKFFRVGTMKVGPSGAETVEPVWNVFLACTEEEG
jgi:hypothetical protein